MLKQITLVVAIILGGMGVAYADGGTITGTVTEVETGLPVPYASVQIEGTHMGSKADSTGRFIIRHVAAGTHNLLVSSVGYHPSTIAVKVSPASQNRIDPALSATQIETGGVVVTATRTPRYIKNVPVHTEVITKATIEDKAAHNIFEALDGEAGVRVEQQCQGCNFSILRMQGLGADHTQFLIDGQPVYSGLAAVYGLQQMSTADVDQIEIVKGAGSALYGSNAIAGAINVISTVPNKTEGNIGIELGEHGTNKYDISAAARNRNLGIFLFAQQSEQDEIDETGDINAPGGVDDPDGWLDRVRAASKNLGFNLFLDNVLKNDRIIFRGRLIDEIRQGGWLTDNQFQNPFAPGTERILTDRYTAQMDYHIWLRGGAEFDISFSYTSHKRDATNDTFLSDYEETFGDPPPVDLLRPYIADEDLFIANLNIIQPLGESHRLLAGGQYRHDNLEESGMYLDADLEQAYSSTSKKKAHEIGVYVQDEFTVNDKLEVVGGLRFDYHTSEDEFRGSGDVLAEGLEPLEYDESTFNPRFSIKFSPAADFILRGSVGSGYRVPYGFSEDLHLCSGSPRVYKGGNLKPEKSFSYSVAADYTTTSITASLNLYRTELKDAIAFTDADEKVIDLGYTYQWENIDDAYVMGIEFSGSMALSERLVLGARGEIFEGKYDNPRDDWIGTEFEERSRNISRYPELAGGLKLDYSLNDWNLIVDGDFKGKMYIDLTEPADPEDVKIHETESFAVFNAKLSREFSNRYTFYLGAKNLADYTQEKKHIDDAAFMYAPVYGRIVYGGVRISL